MGTSQSTSRAAKFSGNGTRRSMRVTRSAPSTDPTLRRSTSVRNTNRNVKEFSKFWSDAGNVNRAKSSTNRSSTRRSSTKAKPGTATATKRNRSVDQLSNNASPASQKSTSKTRRSSNCIPGQMTVKRERSSSHKRGGSVRQSPSPRYSDPQPTPRSDRQTPDLNIAAARLKRLSLTPSTYYYNYQDSPETAIY
ncbi:unnamed protein product [Caenorhabditis angaria]|uniref:Uncharacterized protein n=1 Tax=Caenorhabditis angaria TaxID=860376 RepID=A0A9P1IT74_9PELO|nr:unnamed protein product [Caenorhabditis angaria]